MWKKIIIGFIVVAGLATGIWFGLQALEEETAPISESIQAVPSSAAFIFETHDFHSLWQKLSETNVMWSELQVTDYFREMHATGYFLDSIIMHDPEVNKILHQQSAVISAHMAGASRFDFLYCTAVPGNVDKESVNALMDKVSSGKAILTERIYDETTVTDIKIAGTELEFTYTLKNGLFIASGSGVLVEDAIRHLNKEAYLTDNHDFMQVQRTAGIENTDGNLYINYRSFPNMLATYLNMKTIKQVVPLSAFASWSELDLLLKPNALSFEGFTYSNDTINNYLNIFLNQQPEDVEIPTILPENTAILIEMGISNPEGFLKDYRTYLSKNNRLFEYEQELEGINNSCNCDINELMLSWLGNEIALAIGEPADRSTERNKYIIASTTGLDYTTSSLTALVEKLGTSDNPEAAAEDYKGYSLQRIDLQNIWFRLLGEIFDGFEESHFTIVDDFVVFANSRSALRSLINMKLAGKTLSLDPNYTAFSEEMASESNILIYTNIARSAHLYKDYLTKDYAASIDTHLVLMRKFEAGAMQFSSYKKNLFLNNVYLKYNPVYKQVTSSLWEAQLDTTISRPAWMVTNHKNGNLEVCVQDDANTLYLISATGNILWKRYLTEPIIGDIRQIDVLKNNKLQLLFNTRSNIYLIDRNGNDVTGFPAALTAPASHQLAVMDYDNNRNYRLLIPCIDNKVYNYDQTGKIVDGWAFPGTTSLVRTDIEHFVVNNKDYIFITEDNGKIHLLDRRGNERVNTETVLKGRSDNPVYIEQANEIGKCRVVYTDTAGTIIKAWFNGHEEKAHYNDYSAAHHFMYHDLNGDQSNDFIITDGNQIAVLQRDGTELFTWTADSAIAQPPKVLQSASGENLLGVINLSANVALILNHLGDQLEGMPLYGGSVPVIGDMNRDGSMNMVTTHPDQHVYTYTLR